MIRYTLKCDNDHSFESWFQNAEAFDGLSVAGHVACPECGSSDVHKSLMAPRVQTARSKARVPAAPPPASDRAPHAADATAAPAVATPSPEVQAEIAKLKAKVEAESDYVGDNFVAEARAMHLGDVPERSIYGEAKLADAKELLEDGVPVLPLPFTPTRKVN